MSNIAIKVEGLSKEYRLGQVGRKSLQQDINRWWHTVRGKEDPYLKLGEENNRATTGSSEFVWALRDINFEVQKGEVLGIIGRNGAGKSTLLKILSKVTSPTTGAVKIAGRIASLLEVGTGFHPDLSGRENIFLNGAILGMTKKEITRKFDEIVDFAGVARYIDTPVKRYSSGMYVRLAFAVAAHLEPEILIVDEVLAVGDAEFQKKCLGKMKDVSTNDGRTILFVSHNMVAIKALCSKSIWLEKGRLRMEGETNGLIEKYLAGDIEFSNKKSIDLSAIAAYENRNVKLLKIAVNTKKTVISTNDNVELYLEFESFLDAELNVSVLLYTLQDICVLNSISSVIRSKKGIFYSKLFIPANFLNDEHYKIRVLIVKDTSVPLIDVSNVINFVVREEQRETNWYGKWEGVVRPMLKWEFNQLRVIND